MNRTRVLLTLSLTVTLLCAGLAVTAFGATCAATAPCNLRVDTVTLDSVRMVWDRPADTTRFHHYVVQRKSPGSTQFRSVKNLEPATKTSYTDSGLLPGALYQYRVGQATSSNQILTLSNVLDVVGGVLASSSSTSTTKGSTTTVKPTTTTRPTTTTVAPAPAQRTFSGTVRLAGFEVPAGQRWVFDPNASTTVEVSANAVVRGLLEMRPARPEVVHTLRFVGVNEDRFVGGGLEPLASDVGLWVVGDGRLDVQGSPKAAWNRTGTDPAWAAGDEVVVAPTALGDHSGFGPFRPGSAVPEVAAHGRTYRAEVLNLTRNVVIEGSPPAVELPRAAGANPSGRAHVFIRSTQPQTLRYATIRYMGPRKFDSATGVSTDVVGRYGLHFHHAFDGSRGSLVEGVVVRDAGSHAFAAHQSHGITFRDTISHNTFEDAYWWDGRLGPPTNERFGERTDDTTYQRAVAALVRSDNNQSQYRLAGFVMGQGTGNAVRDSVAVGVQGLGNSSGFLWREGDLDFVWTFTNNLAHNNKAEGIFWWQVDVAPHRVDGFDSYRNGRAGIEHGAYLNNAQYRNVRSYQDGERAGLILKAGDHEGLPTLRFEDVAIDAGGVSPAAVEFANRALTPAGPSQLVRFHVQGWTDRALVVDDETHALNDGPVVADLVCWTVGPERRDLQAGDIGVRRMSPDSVIRVQRRDGTAFQLTGGTGTVAAIPSFASC
jgi:hypothetical protein